MTILELQDVIESNYRQQRNNEKRRIERLFALADAIGSRVSFVLGGETDIIQPWDMWPDLFEEEKELAKKEAERRELEEYKRKRAERAAIHNERIRRENVNSTQNTDND